MKNIKSKLIPTLFAAFLFLGVAAVSVSAQRPTPTPDPILQACEETADKLKRTELERDSLKMQLDLANQKLSVKDEQIANKEEQIQFWKKASETGDKVDTNSQLIIQHLRTQVAEDIIRIKDLEQENKSLRRSRDWRTAIGFAAGFGTGYWVNSR